MNTLPEGVAAEKPNHDSTPAAPAVSSLYRGNIINMRHVLEWLYDQQVMFDLGSGSFRWQGADQPHAKLVKQIHANLLVRGNDGKLERIKKELIEAALDEHVILRRKIEIDRLQASLCGAPRTNDSTLRSWLAQLMTPDTDAEEFENCVVVMKQWLWLVQRSILGLQQKWHVMPIFWSSTQGSGKSTQVRRLLEPLASFAQEKTFDMFKDMFDQKAMHNSFVIFFDEMDKADKVEATAVKRAISADYVSGRGMYSDDGRRLRRNASFIATTNAPPTHGLQDTTGARRFYSFHCREEKWIEGGPREQFVNSLNFLDIWHCVSPHRFEAPIGARQQQITQRQAEVNRSRSLYESFLEERCARVTDEEGQPDPNARLHFRLLSDELKSYIDAHVLRDATVPSYRQFKTELEALGIKCVNSSNIYFAIGLKLRDAASEALLLDEE